MKRYSFKNESREEIQFCIEPWGFAYGLNQGDNVKVIYENKDDENKTDIYFDKVDGGELITLYCYNSELDKIIKNGELIVDY